MKFPKGALLLISILVFSTLAFAKPAIGTFNTAVNQEVIESGQMLKFKADIVNYDSKPYTDVKTRVMLKRTDGAVVYSSEKTWDFAPKEVETVKEEFQVPSLSSGNYTLFVKILGPTYFFISSSTEEIRIEGDREGGVLFKSGPFLKVPRIMEGDDTRTIVYLKSTGNVGENIPPGESFYLLYDLENTGQETREITSEIEIVNTYQQNDTVKELSHDIPALSPQEEKTTKLELNMTRSGTYRCIVSLYDEETGEKIGQKDVRIVIAGAGGSIVEVENAKDVYEKADTVNISATIVGPADSATEVKDAYLDLKITQDDRTIEKTKQITKLPLTPESLNFSFQTSFDLEDYELSLELGKGEEVFDRVSTRYQELNPQRIMTSYGEVKELDSGMCFDDGECTKEEFELGDCYDCRNVEEWTTTTTTTSSSTTSTTSADKTTSTQGVTTTTGEKTDEGGFNLMLLVGIILLVIVAFLVFHWRNR